MISLMRFSQVSWLPFFLALLFLTSCNINQQSAPEKQFRFLALGEYDLMAENLRKSLPNLSATCYNDSLVNCEKYGVLYNWTGVDSICPLGWHLPNTDEVFDLIRSLPGRTNANNGKVMDKESSKILNAKFGGAKNLINDQTEFYGKNWQEIWLVSSDSIWTNPNNSDEKYQLIGLHIYPRNADSITVEPTFSDTPTEFYGYCRCIRRS